MDVTTALELTKARIGITSAVRDTYLTAILEGVVSELRNVQGLTLDLGNSYQLMFVVDLATWRYENRDGAEAMPRHLKFRLHNLMISEVGKNVEP